MKRLIRKAEEISDFSKNDIDYKIYCNPTFNEFNTLMETSSGYVNALIDNSNLYIWNSILSYDEIISHLGYGNDGTKLTINYNAITVDDSLGYDYTYQQLFLIKDILFNMLAKDDYSIDINLVQNGYNGKLHDFFENNEI